MSKKFISFITPVYNVNLYLDDFFASFKSLPKDQYEIIVVNDKSPENPLEIISKGKSSVNIKYIENKKNLGPGYSRNIAIKNISKKSTHFLPIDPDDKLAEGAGDQISRAKDNLVSVSDKFIMFDMVKSVEKHTGRSSSFVGSGVLSAWGNLIPVSKRNILFTSRTFEDFRGMAEITRDNQFCFFNKAIVEYRNRASSIMNTPYNSRRRAEYISEHSKELAKSLDNGLIKDKTVFMKDMKNLFIEFWYVSKKKRKGLNFETSFFSKATIFGLKIISTLQKMSRFGGGNSFFTKRRAFK